jgi:hypothetical protein
MMDSSGSGHSGVAARAAPHQVAAFKARLAAASRPDTKVPSPKGRWAALRPGALAARPAAARQLSTIESAGSDGLNATGPRQMAHDTSSSSSRKPLAQQDTSAHDTSSSSRKQLSQQDTASSTASHLRDVATEEGLNTTESSGFDTSGASFLGPLGIGPFESSGEGVKEPTKQRTFSETGEVSPARKPRPPQPPARRDCPAMTLERSTIFGFREEKDKYSMRKYGSCSSFDRQSFDHSGHSLFGVESVASDGDGSPIKDKDGVRPAPSMSSPLTVPEESPSPTALAAPRHPSRVIAFAAVGAACAAEVALRWGAGDAYPRDVALRASGALWCIAALAAARTL